MSRISPFSNTTKRSFCGFIPIATLSALLLGPHAAAQSTEVQLTLLVCRSGPALVTARAERGLGAAEVRAIEPMQNPSLVIEHQQTLSGPRDRETVLGSAIPLPISGRRGILRDAAQARRRAADARADADLLRTALDFREAYALAVVEHERAALMQKHQKALQDLATALQQLSARGETAAYDVQRHDVEVRLHARSLASASAHADRAERRLSQWLTSGFDRDALSVAGLSRTLFAAAPSSAHPEVITWRSTARAAKLESDAARRRWFPEPEIFAGYRRIESGDQTGHGMRLGVSLPLTLFEHGQGASARALAERALSEARAGRLQRELDVELSSTAATLTPLEAALHDAELNLQTTERLKDQARTLYGAGEASIAELLDAYRTCKAAALDWVAALEELLAARLAVMRAAGKQFDPDLDASCAGSARAAR